jgi:putative transposase
MPALQVAEEAREHPVADLSQERIKRRPVLGGLINEYQRAE